jgi:serine/threonine-protein kinase
MDQLGEYRVRRLIGEGGMGKVYEAEERLSKRRVARRSHAELAKASRAVAFPERDAISPTSTPEHRPSLASTGSTAAGDGPRYLDDLRSAGAGSGRLPWAEAAGIVCSVASALAAARRREPPIIHRDLKPENIMVRGRVGEGDGLRDRQVIEALQMNTRASAPCSTWPRSRSTRTIDHRSDLYCLG